MSRRLFGTDGIRGLAGHAPLTAELVLALGRAVAHHFRSGIHRPRVVVGRDTRLSGDMLESAFCAGVSAAGADVIRVGVVPTPAVAFLTHSLGASAGAMLSASHNPFEDNGIKLFAADGFKLSDEEELQIEQGIHHADVQNFHVTGEALGRVLDGAIEVERYCDSLRASVPAGVTLQGLRIVLDVGYGAAYALAGPLFESLGAEVICLHDSPNGTNINAQSGALHPEALQAAVIAHQAHLGAALDGDADRLILVDEHGHIRDGDACLALCGRELKALGKLPGDTVVATQMSNLGLEVYLEKHGIALERTQVGDRYVVQALREKGLALGGEQSGHVIFLEHATTGDGLLATLQVAAVMNRTRKSLSELLEGLVMFPQVLLNVRLKQRKPLEELQTVMAAIDRARCALGHEGRVLVRFSGTEPLARVMMEGRELEQIHSLAGDIADAIALELEGVRLGGPR